MHLNPSVGNGQSRHTFMKSNVGTKQRQQCDDNTLNAILKFPSHPTTTIAIRIPTPTAYIPSTLPPPSRHLHPHLHPSPHGKPTFFFLPPSHQRDIRHRNGRVSLASWFNATTSAIGSKADVLAIGQRIYPPCFVSETIRSVNAIVPTRFANPQRLIA